MMQTQRSCERLRSPVTPVRAPTGVTHCVCVFFNLAPHLTCAFYQHEGGTTRIQSHDAATGKNKHHYLFHH